MILLFSEAQSDYSRYLYPYVIWAVPEPGEKASDLFRSGCLPASPQLDRYYLCRNLRVDLGRFKASSENRRILRKGEGIKGELIPRDAFLFTDERRRAWKAYADHRFGDDIMSAERLETLMQSPVISHLLHFEDAATGLEVGTVLMFIEEPEIAFYYYAFYDLAYLGRNLGMYMMTWAVDFFKRQGVSHLHLGTCYSQRALYKTQFTGIEFFNGLGWSRNLDELRFMIGRDESSASRHLLDSTEYLTQFQGNSFPTLCGGSQWRCGARGRGE